MKFVKLKKIVAEEFCHAHPANKRYATDKHYIRLANRLIEDFAQLRPNLGVQTPAILRYSAIMLACYMEDVAADSGVWRAFATLCRQMFGNSVPLFHSDEEYYDDEPSPDVVRYLMWHAANEMDDIWWHIDSDELSRLADVAYDRLSQAFEQVPVNTELVEDTDALLRQSTIDFNHLRQALIWIYTNCYLTRSHAGETLIAKNKSSLDDIKNVAIEPDLKMYHAVMTCIFNYKISPLALEAKDYLAALLRIKSMENEAEMLAQIEPSPTRIYKYTIAKDGQWLHLTGTNGKELTLARSEITLDDEQLRKHDGCLAQFIMFQGEWRLNGIFMPIPGIGKTWDELVKNDPEYLPKGSSNLTGEMLLKRNSGHEILYFENFDKLRGHLLEKLDFRMEVPQRSASGIDSDTPAMLFIDKNAETFGMHLTFGFAPCIADPKNPYYDPEVARDEAIEMLWNEQAISTPAMHYLLDHGYLPDICDSHYICPEDTPEQKLADIRFLLRYMRKEKY